MYCFRCGRKLPGREINCPDCDTPQKKRKRRHKRMVLGLFIFLSGAFAGSFFDTYLFKGEAWNHSFFGKFLNKEQLSNNDSDGKVEIASPSLKIEVKYKDEALKKVQESQPSSETFSSEKALTETTSKSSDSEKEVSLEVAPIAETLNNSTVTSKSVEENNSTKAVIDKNEIEGVPAEISKILSESPSESVKENEPVGISVVKPTTDEKKDIIISSKPETLSNNDDVIIVEELESTSDAIDEAKESSEKSLYTEAVPINETIVSVPETKNEGHLVYKNISLLEAVNADSYHGFMSKDCKELIFASNRLTVNGKATYQCFTKSPSEKELAKRVFEWKGNVWTPELTPDGNMIVFSSDSDKPEHIYLYDRKSGKSMALTSGTSKNMMPSISPDGKKIAFVSNRVGGKFRIWMMDLYNPRNLVQVTRGDHDREPSWSPDGKSIVFTRIKVNMKDSRIMKVNVGSNEEPVELVSLAARNWMASISPDGKLLAFTRSLSEAGSHNSIVLKELASSKEEILSFPGIFDSFRPIWNSDSSGFVFHAARKNGKCIYQANFKKE